jgi:tetratricopeptide (TPR) repeat protein
VTRRARLALATLAAAGAIAAGAAATPAPREPYAALGALRPLVVDALFLRAEALRRRGKPEEVASLYRRVLEVEPGSEEARDFLAATEAYDLRAVAATDAERVRWFRAALHLVDEGLARDPDSARLRWRAADLLVHAGDLDPAVAADLAAAGRDRLGEALDHLARSVRRTDSLGRLGYQHLADLVALVPRVAAERLSARRPGVAAALEVGEDALARRGDALARFRARPEASVAGDAALRAGVNLVRGVAAALSATPPRLEDARGLLDTYETALGEDRASRALRALVR